MTDVQQEQIEPVPYVPDLFNDYPALAPIVGEIVATRVRTVDTQDIADMHLYPALREAGVRIETSDERDQAVGLLAAMVDQVKILICVPVPDFFEPGRYYVENKPYRAPEIAKLFHCQLVTRHPTAGDEMALGFGRVGLLDEHSGGWHLTALSRDDWQQGWVEKP